MSDETTNEPVEGADTEPSADLTAEVTKWKELARKHEKAAKENVAAAKRLAEIEEASKSELQKAQERIQELEGRASQAERSALQTRIATELGVPVEVVHGDNEEAMRASAQKVIEWRDAGKRQAPAPKQLKSGSGSEPAAGERGRAAAALRALRQG